jgi:hypothetical protein
MERATFGLPVFSGVGIHAYAVLSLKSYVSAGGYMALHVVTARRGLVLYTCGTTWQRKETICLAIPFAI